MRGWDACALALMSALLGACGFVSQNPHDQKRAWQEQQARRLAPARVAKDPQRWGKVRVVKVRIHADPGYRERHADWAADFERQLSRANETLRPALEIRLEAREALEWEPAAAAGDLDALLNELEAHDAGDEVEWVIGLVGAEPRAVYRFNEFGRARVLGKHLVLRDMDDATEKQAFEEGLDTFDEGERRRLYVARRQHKETVSLLHEIGHTLGAIHTREPTWIMHGAYHQDMAAYAPDNQHLMWRVLHYRLEGAGTEVLMQQVEAFMGEAEGEAWDVQARARMLAEVTGGAEPQVPEAAPAPVAGPVLIEKHEDDMMALALPDRTRFQQAQRAAKEGKGADVWAEIEALADAYPDVYATQHLACEVAMRQGKLGVAQRYCERMTELAKKLE